MILLSVWLCSHWSSLRIVNNRLLHDRYFVLWLWLLGLKHAIKLLEVNLLDFIHISRHLWLNDRVDSFLIKLQASKHLMLEASILLCRLKASSGRREKIIVLHSFSILSFLDFDLTASIFRFLTNDYFLFELSKGLILLFRSIVRGCSSKHSCLRGS